MDVNGQGNKGPSIAELQKFVREKTRLEFALVNGEKRVGTLRWFDEDAFGISDGEDRPLTILRPAVISYTKTEN